MPESSDISVIVPTFRRPALLAEALASLLVPSALSIDVTVIDDSPDGEGEAVVQACHSRRVRYSRWPSPTGGRPALLRNAAARATHGRVLYFLDDDDLVRMDGLVAAFGLLQACDCGVFVSIPEPFGANPAHVASEQAFYLPARGLFAAHISAADLSARMIFSDAVLTCSSCMLKRDAFERAGGFDEHLGVAEDVDFYARAIALAGFVYGAEAIARRRVGQPSLMSQVRQENLDLAYAEMRAGFRRRQGLPDYLRYRLRYCLNTGRLNAWRERLGMPHKVRETPS